MEEEGVVMEAEGRVTEEEGAQGIDKDLRIRVDCSTVIGAE